MIREQVEQQFYEYKRDIENLTCKKNIDIEQLGYYFLCFVEFKARLERFGQKVNVFEVNAVLKTIEPYHDKILSDYENDYGFYLAEEIIECAKLIEKNLPILCKNNSEEAEFKDEIEEKCFLLFLKFETSCLIFNEMKKLYSKYDLKNISICLSHMEDAFRNVYIPHNVQKKIQRYVGNNNVDVEKMSWFCRPTIDEIPALLHCELEEMYAGAMVENIEKNKVVPLHRIPYHFELKMAGSSSPNLDQIYQDTVDEEDAFEDPIFYEKKSYVEIRIALSNNKFFCEIDVEKQGKLDVYYNSEKQKIAPDEQNHVICLGYENEVREEIIHLRIEFNETVEFEKECSSKEMLLKSLK